MSNHLNGDNLLSCSEFGKEKYMRLAFGGDLGNAVLLFREDKSEYGLYVGRDYQQVRNEVSDRRINMTLIMY